ncbi:hypothetical protein SLS60_009598 [Paraconiothyrium brasiliense]|uniref:Uncharacterized protein n=1 Tax=Paraconiothyrium brasiliense TaxID=300254 RepID=A0ABR3QV76_9PLEO
MDHVKPRSSFEHLELNLTSLDRSVAGNDRTLARRAPPFTDADFAKSVDQGCALTSMMILTDDKAARYVRPENTHTTAESPWTVYQSLNDWGWLLAPKHVLDQMTTSHYEGYMNPVMEDLGLPHLDTPKFNGFAEGRQWGHSRDRLVNGIEYKFYQSTGASSDFFIDVTHGLIFATYTYGPAYMAAEFGSNTPLPQLKNLYDILYLDYAYLAAQKHEQVNKLKYLFIDDIENDETRAIAYRCVGVELSIDTCFMYQWPRRRVFYPGQECYKALIASPNGRSMALILATHKSVFGQQKIIGSISVFCQSPSSAKFNLLFIVDDYNEAIHGSTSTDEKEHPVQPALMVPP